ncbi:hypothetical protein QBC34DRAFT_411849 [Podospora aff. communis PSN243]|uniref:Carbohydrate-binding module family 18 protein n=1 Tax=Podospora aff. communis PSN243 TaxID=3040156 RepID=A0AAV9GF66_9PEZI|nr:hypothetical protein QBC34DRAFT_411849 [Podospora aff. communis PSN243]
MWSQISGLATRALALLGSREKGEVRIETREELQITQGWAEPKVLESGANNSAQAVLDILSKRQTCAPGYGYCSNFGGCCPASDRCCSYGYCMTPGRVCCPSGSCPGGSNCCGSNCHPVGTQCCSNGRYCDAGNICVRWEGSIVCCTDLSCTANVVGTTTIRATTRATTRTTTATLTRATYDWYTYTVYWTYRYYYWYYIAAATASVVTYSSATTTTTVTVYASDRIDATLSLREITATMWTTPASATSLASLVGVTSSSSTRSRATPTNTGSSGGPGFGASAANSLDIPAACFMVGGLVVGVMAVWL